MKKVLSLLLALALCLSLGACASGKLDETEPEETKMELDILGEWVNVMDNTHTLTFLEDGTCFYTGTPPTVSAPNTVTIVLGDPDSDTDKYKYTFDPEVAIITIYSTISLNNQVVIEDGKVVIASVGGVPCFVRAEDYEEYHAAYLEQAQRQKQEQIDAFYKEGKEGRTELVRDTAYEIQSGLNMTVTGSHIAEFESLGLPQTELYLKIVLENTSDTEICIRENGYEENGTYHYGWRSDVSADIEVRRLNEIVHISGGTGEACDYVFRFEELGQIRQMGGGNPICLAPGEQGEYYLLLTSQDVKGLQETTAYAIMQFENYEFFCDVTAFLTAD